MLDRILAFFENKIEEEKTISVDESAAVLLIEIMVADHSVLPAERQCIETILIERTGGTSAEVSLCIDAAMKIQDESHDLYQFTKQIGDQWDESKRYKLVVDLWRVAISDGDIDKYEDHRIRRVTELLRLHHSHFIRAKSEAKELLA